MINKIIVCAVLSVIAVSNAAFALCQTYSQCNLSCRNSGGQCCAEEKTTYDCPSGWYASGSTCYRNSTDAGSDAKGYKKQYMVLVPRTFQKKLVICALEPAAYRGKK